jgi:hypothetical protein
VRGHDGCHKTQYPGGVGYHPGIMEQERIMPFRVSIRRFGWGDLLVYQPVTAAEPALNPSVICESVNNIGSRVT